MKSSTRILYITSFWPHAESSGSQLRTLHVSRALKNVGKLDLCVLAYHNTDEEEKRKSVEEFGSIREVALERANTTRLDRLMSLLNPRRMNLYHSIVKASERERLLGTLENYDMVWLHHLYVSYLYRCWHWPRSVMDIDDIPSTYQRTVWHESSNLPEKLQAGWKMWQWKRRERLLEERFSELAVCSEQDRDYLGGVKRAHVIPNGFERPAVEPVRNPCKPPRIGFIGLMDYPPNLDGTRWFIRECWPMIKREISDARLRLVGKWRDDSLKPQGPDIDCLGWVADPTEEIETWSSMIVPVHTGAGTRIKIAEAFSRKCPLVSTRLGVFGYDVQDRTELCIADTPENFSAACLRLIRDPVESAAMAERAWRRFLGEWTWDAIAPRIWSAAEECLRGRTPMSG
jgi:glycosyltransferase involved in cell wall biosynthesis